MSPTDEEQVRALIERWAQAIGALDLEGVVANHAADIAMFDVPPPLEWTGIDAYRASFAGFLPWIGDTGRFDLQDLIVVAGSDVAYAHCLVSCAGTNSDGTRSEFGVRLTIGLHKLANRWLISHEHHSVPAGE
jgi:uncharacterized protein (TIGR02246 family)